MSLRPGTTGRVLPFPASLVRDDPRIDAYVDLKTVPSLPDLGNIPLVPETDSDGNVLRPSTKQLSTTTLLQPPRSQSRLSGGGTGRNSSVYSLNNNPRKASLLATAKDQQQPDAPAGKIEDVIIAAVVAKAAEPTKQLPYKMPDLFMNMIRRKRQLEQEAKHPERGHTRVLFANYSRPVYRKVVEVVKEDVGDVDAVSVVTSVGKKEKAKKKRYSVAQKYEFIMIPSVF
ncbi:UNVERIFIED_CONTAM: hypothetical protein HDU68_011492 [Siphonaria sp. JEL0065]|nr:hypothetical protein HDU68_011492 [Siphonaria sp. JEL0065]